MRIMHLTNGEFSQCSDIIDGNSNLTLVDTLNGKIQGLCETVTVINANNTKINSHVISWKSIPYAEPPINELRFARPLPVKDWTGIKKGLQYPTPCTQIDVSGNIVGSEDCLYLNVFVRSDVYLNRTSLLSPILVFIHGGDFSSGSSADYDQSTLVALSGIIVITIQYRLNVFGFLRLEETFATGNQGLLDQNLALKWIYDNCRYFGGDQTRITINGANTGADSVISDYLIKKIFSRY